MDWRLSCYFRSLPGLVSVAMMNLKHHFGRKFFSFFSGMWSREFAGLLIFPDLFWTKRGQMAPTGSPTESFFFAKTWKWILKSCLVVGCIRPHGCCLPHPGSRGETATGVISAGGREPYPLHSTRLTQKPRMGGHWSHLP